MFGLKGAYFYLIAVQITFIKFIKKIYFTSNHYNKSLESKIPIQIFFSPNPFLLSIISPFSKKSFKINEINPNDFWLENKTKKFEKYHNFLWLSLIDRKVDGKNIQKIIYIWMLKFSSFRKSIWETSTLSSRVISWILNIDIITNNASFEFKKSFFQNIVLQSTHLRRNIGFENDPFKKIQILTALVLSGLVFKEREENYEVGIKELEKFSKIYFDSDGYPVSRNSNDLIIFTKYLILCHENIKDAQKYIPEFLDEIIRKNLGCIKLLKTPNDQMPFFNGVSENDLSQFDKYLENFKIKKKSD